jgi:hypothetical protein
MLDVYNTVLQLARERQLDINTFSSDQPPTAMPRLDDMIAALDKMYADRYTIPDVTKIPVLRHGLMRMSAINKMVLEYAARLENEASVLVGVSMPESRSAGSDYWSDSTSGEMICPECKNGTLCYLLGSEGGAFVECSTVGCLYWDARR